LPPSSENDYSKWRTGGPIGPNKSNNDAFSIEYVLGVELAVTDDSGDCKKALQRGGLV
jgi:hypothetical protein